MALRTNTKLVPFLVFAVFILGFYVLDSKVPKTQNTDKTATMIINFDNSGKVFQGTVVEQMTFLEALIASADYNGIAVRYYVDGKNKTHISMINGNTNNFLGQKWAFFLNKEQVSASDINTIRVGEGDMLEARFD